MDELSRRLSPTTGSSSNVELTHSNKHSNEVDFDPSTGLTKSSDYNRRFNERVQSDVEKLKDGSIHRHRYKLHESNENQSTISKDDKSPSELSSASRLDRSRLTNDLQSSRLTSDLSTSRLTDLPSSSRLPSRLPASGSSSRLRYLLDDDDDLGITRSKIKDYDPLGARLAKEVGIDVRSKPISFNYEQEAKRRAHEALLREIDDDDEKFRTLPPTDPFRYKAREQMFAQDWDEKDLRYLSKEGRQDLIRPIQPYVKPEQPFKHKRKSKYGKFVEGF